MKGLGLDSLTFDPCGNVPETGDYLSDEDVGHLESVLTDSEEVKRLVDARPDLQDLHTRAVTLYHEITRQALENEQAN